MSSSTQIGKLSIDTVVNTAALTTGIKASVNEITSWVGQIGRLSTSIQSLAGVSAAVGAAFRGLSALDQLAVDAQKIGVTTQSLSQLQHAAAMTDVETSALQGGVQKLVKTLGDAQMGGSQAIAAFDALGLSIGQVSQMTSTELFAEVAQRLSEVESVSVQASLGNDLFGRSFQNLIPLINQGRDGINAYNEEAKALGLVLSDDQTKRVDEANTAWDRFKQATDGATKQIAASLAPAFEDLFELGTVLLTDVLKPIIPVLTAIGYAIGFTAKIITTALAGVVMIVDSVIGVILKAGGVFSDELDSLADEWFESAANAKESIDRVWTATDEVSSKTKTLGAEGVGAWTDIKNAASAAGGEIVNVWTSVYDSVKKYTDDLKKDADDLIKKWRFDNANFGIEGRERQIAELIARGMSENDPRIQALRLENEQLKIKEEQAKLAKEIAKAEEDAAKRLLELKKQARSEDAVIGEKLGEAAGLLFSGQLSNEEYQSIAAQAFGNQQQTFGQQNSLPFSSAAAFGSDEAREIILRSATGGNSDPWRALAKNSENQLNELKELNRNMKNKSSEELVAV